MSGGINSGKDENNLGRCLAGAPEAIADSIPARLSEAQWIDMLSTSPIAVSEQAVLGLGSADDAACVLWPGQGGDHCPLLATSTDSIGVDVHFAADAPAWWLAQRIIRAGISDLYAVGAEPQYILINIVDKFLEKQHYTELLESISNLAIAENLTLLGGNTTRGIQRQIHIFALGRVAGTAITPRAGARVGDLIALSGPTGCYAHARRLWDWRRMILPDLRPWLAVIRDRASACIDVSDGLVGDLGQICRRSAVGAHLWSDRLTPRQTTDDVDEWPCLDDILYGGEDYVLMFTIPKEFIKNNDLQQLSPLIIGRIVADDGISLYANSDEQAPATRLGSNNSFDHFRAL
ncbi:MAG: thiamine-phosphate kinase [Proteobacteria bacterium]|nr:thiamine-phosphate kinase [Pseudomonadota bacterium]